jgi:hypothetical protein
MSIGKVKYASLDDLLSQVQLAEEDAPTAKIIKRLRHVRTDKELSRGEFLDICYWKSPRGVRRCEKNSARAVEETTQKVFATRSEKTRIDLLTSLEGVSIPTASAILTLTDPRNYGVIDIRVWQVLHALGSVTSNPRGQNFTCEQWLQFLRILRQHSRQLKVPTRLIELTIFKYHRDHQSGTLYGHK